MEDFIVNVKGADDNLKTKISINNKINTSFSADYKLISASVSFAPKFIPGNDENELKGKSSFSNITLRFFPKKFIQTAYYTNTKGFYLENTQDFLPNWQKGKDPYIQLPNFNIQSFGGSTSYVINDNFSIKSVYYQREWQKESSGSFIPNLDYELAFLRDQSEDGRSVERQFNIGGSLAYYYNWAVNEHINIVPFGFSGIGGKFSNYHETSNEGSKSPNDKNEYFTFNYGGGLNLGYNSENWLFGSQFNYRSYNYSENASNTVANNKFYGLLYVGYRFAPPKKVEQKYNELTDKIPFL